MPQKILVIYLIIISYIPLFGQADSSRHILVPHLSPSLKFTENNGQWDSKILFRTQLDGGALFIEKNCLTFNFYDKKKYRAQHHGGFLKTQYKDLNINGTAYKIYFEGCNEGITIEKLQQGIDYENFFVGNDETKWKGNVKNYRQAWLRNLYEGIDYELIAAANGVKYNLYVKPHKNPDAIKMRYEGVENIKLKDGVLTLKLNVNEIIEKKPYAYQLINGVVKKVACNYVFRDKILSFEFPKGYDKNFELIIDPQFVFAAQSGSTADNFGMTGTFDTDGNLYSGGTVFNIGYPTTIGAYSIVFNGPYVPNTPNTDVVITKYNATLSGLIYSTYIGGTGTEVVSSLIVDNSNNLCFYGATGSANFPMIAGAYDNTFNGGQFLSFYFNGTAFNNGTDIYIGKFNASGTSLLASTFLGGSGNDGVNHVNHLSSLNTPQGVVQEYVVDSLQYNYGDQYRGEIQVDLANNIYITSSTRSSDFPTVNSYDNSLGGKQDAIVAKFNSSLSQLLYCTYLGGTLNDCGNSLIVNNNFEVYVTGGTCSSDFPTTLAVNSPTYNGGKADGYITHFNANGNSLLQSTFVGTLDYDQSYFIQSDRSNNIYVYGQSLGNMPVINSGTTTAYSNAGKHQFITRYTSTLSTINLSTVFGSNNTQMDISPSAFAVDKCNNIYLSGWGGPIIPPSTPFLTGMPITPSPSTPTAATTQSVTDGHDFYLMGLGPDATALLYGSYFGGNQSEEHVDGGTSRFDPRGVIYQSVCAGCGGNDDFPVTPGAWPNTPGNPNHNTDNFNCNNGVFKIYFQLLVTVSTINTNTVAGCVPLTVSFTNATAPTATNASYIWYNNGTTNSTVINPVYTYTNPGTYTVSLVVKDPASCNVKDSSITYITVYPLPTANFSFSTTPCSNSITTSNTSVGNFGTNAYLWNFGNAVTSSLTAPSYTYPANGNFNISLKATDVNGCSNTISKPVTIFNFSPGVVSSGSICLGSSTQLIANGGTSYTWSPANTLNNTSTVSPIANPTISTIYTVNILNNSAGFPCAGTLTTQILVNPRPAANFSYSGNPCGGGIYFTDLSTANITNWNWRLAPTVTASVQNPYNFYGLGGNYNIRLLVTNNFGCKDSMVKVLSVLTPPPLSINAPTMVCKDNSVQLSASGGTAYAWTPTLSIDFPFLSNPNASPQVNTQYSVVISTTNTANGLPCSFLLVTSVTVAQLSTIPVTAMAAPSTIITGNSTTLTYIGDPGATVTWYPTGSTNPATGYTVSASPIMPTTYTAIATNGACRQNATVSVDAYTEGCIDKDVFVPNTFTPNGDGQNDIFLVRGLKIDEVYFAVYNRWGEKVFDTDDKTKGWDGTYKGRAADIGVFGWYLKVKCVNGEETFRKGNVTLVR